MSEGSSGHETTDLEPKPDGYNALFVFAFVIFILCVYSCFENDSNIEPNEDYLDRVLRERRQRASTINHPVPSYCLERVATEVNTADMQAPDSYSEDSPILSINSANRTINNNNIDNSASRHQRPSSPSLDNVSSDLPSYGEAMNQLFDIYHYSHSSEMPCTSQSPGPTSIYVSSHSDSPQRSSYSHQPPTPTRNNNSTQDSDLPSYGEAMALLASMQSNCH